MESKSSSSAEAQPLFSTLPLDRRVFKALARQGLATPTPAQAASIAGALAGKDIVLQASTGSGKTLAYAIPMVDFILRQATKKDTSLNDGMKALILVPSHELSVQVQRTVKSLLFFAPPQMKCVAISGQGPIAAQVALLREKPQVIVATATRLVKILNRKDSPLSFKDTLKILVLDEADLLLSYGYEDDIRALLTHLPKLRQTFLMSATLSPEVDTLRSLVVHDPEVISLQSSTAMTGLRQFSLNSSEKDKFLHLYTLIKLGMMTGKTLIFVNSIFGCYKLKLLMEAFHIHAAVLNAELPFNSRMHLLQQYNRGVYEFLIVTDDSVEYDESAIKPVQPDLMGDEDQSSSDSSSSDDEDEGKTGGQSIVISSGKAMLEESDEEDEGDFSVARGFDFKNVQTVVNYDFPKSAKSYVHRIGRTARGGADGDAVSLVTPEDRTLFNAVEAYLEENNVGEIKVLPFNKADADSFRYRVDDMRNGVTEQAIREARGRELRLEMMHSDKLKAHFEDNPRELALLKHNQKLSKAPAPAHLKVVPAYLRPESAPHIKGGAIGSKNRKRKAPSKGGRGGRNGGGRDPLKSLRPSAPLKPNSKFNYKQGYTGKKPGEEKKKNNGKHKRFRKNK